MRVAVLICTFVAALFAAVPARAECLAAPDLPADAAAGPAAHDRQGRLVAPVMVNGQGPFRFIVDTGANRSVLSRRLAEQLGLVPSGVGMVHSIDNVSEAPLASITSLRYGALDLPSGATPLLEGPVLAGEDGLLGVDGMRGRRLRMDFERRCIEITPARNAGMLRGWEMVRGELRFGHLVMVRAAVRGVRVNVLIDTGSDTSLANTALQEALRTRMRDSDEAFGAPRAFTAGQTVVLDNIMVISQLSMGELELDNVAAYVGDFHIFALWDLLEDPTLLIGMDVLSQTKGLAIDYDRARVFFDLGDRRRGRWAVN
ncbi:aspartyl protease family protein [Terricaulis silvestris]|uniref:Clan AA aspartic protease n=1 Tax=Terricaulis silvestris TaxID=2686094 RepID=A0A6I6MI54_9CAUL|nr:retroviral-like aspartic protease family protein [Terricaulis silvestris]QGZ94159.1 clan AA aspartic protease [Terricaulis silvestris]